jgi:hypothetical protein
MNGTITIDTSGRVGYGSEPPGRITHFGSNGDEVSTNHFRSVFIKVRGTNAANDTYFDPEDMIGINMYLKEEKEAIEVSTRAFWMLDDLAPLITNALKRTAGGCLD